jgi:hypothetical protein
MASSAHQFIMGLVIKAMQDADCKIIAMDGKYPGLLGECLPLPPQVTRHRPDVVAIHRNQQVCLGEAKTGRDVASVRTREQLNDFTNVQVNGLACDVYVGVPGSSRVTFDHMLRTEGLDRCENLHVLYIPDEIIND